MSEARRLVDSQGRVLRDLRMSKIRTCLFSVTEHDLRSRLRNGCSDDEIAAWLQDVVWQKEPGHRIGEPEFVPPPRSMSCIGG